jgi:hypothetical protein
MYCMTKKNEPYSCWFLINRNEKDRAFKVEETDAADSFINFLSDKDYGKGIRVFLFDMYVEPEKKFGRYGDTANKKHAHLSAHIEYTAFINADSSYRHKLLLNGALFLCKYLSEKLPLPKDFDANGLVKDFTAYLEKNSLLLADTEIQKMIIKPFDTTRFGFLVATTAEVNEKEIHYDLNHIQDYLNNKLSGKTFGKTVQRFDFGYQIYDSQGYMLPWPETADLKRYGLKFKNLFVVKHFDYRQLKDKTHFEQFEILKEKILEAINDTEKLNRKPKGFDRHNFLVTIEEILTDYQKKYCC